MPLSATLPIELALYQCDLCVWPAELHLVRLKYFESVELGPLGG